MYIYLYRQDSGYFMIVLTIPDIFVTLYRYRFTEAIMKHLFSLLTVMILISGCACKNCTIKPDPKKLVLFDFEDESELKNIFTENGPGDVTKIFPFERVAENSTSGKYSLKVSYPPNGQWPGAHFTNFSKDWSKYNYFCVDVYNPLKHPVSFHTATIDEDAGVTPDNPFGIYALRFHGSFTVRPGKNTIEQDLGGLLVQDGSREPKFDKIKMFVFMVVNRSNDEVLYFDNIRLENREDE